MSALKFAAIVVAFLLGAPLAFAQNAPQPIGPNGTASGGSSNLTFPATVSGTVNSGGIPYFSSSTAMASSAALTANALVIGGGAGEPPVSASGLTYVGGQLLAPEGSNLAPSFSFTDAPTSGMFYSSSFGYTGKNGTVIGAGPNSSFGFDESGDIYWFYGGVTSNNPEGEISLGAGSGTDISLTPGSGGYVFFNDGYTVATLPSNNQEGGHAYVTDQLTACPAIGLTMTGGGSVVCPVFNTGSGWVSG